MADFLFFYVFEQLFWLFLKKYLSKAKSTGNIFNCQHESWWNQYGWLAQLAEQRTLNPWVQGSIPWPPIIWKWHCKKAVLFLCLKLNKKKDWYLLADYSEDYQSFLLIFQKLFLQWCNFCFFWSVRWGKFQPDVDRFNITSFYITILTNMNSTPTSYWCSTCVKTRTY